MKKITLLFLFFSLAVSAQVFPEYDPTLLKPGMKVAVRDTYAYGHFFQKDDLYKHYKENENSYTDPDAIKGRTFEIIDIKESKKNYYLIDLKDITNQEIIIYKYERGNAIYELRLLDTIEFPADYFCNYIWHADTDEFSSVTYQGIKLSKFLDKGKPTYILRLISESINKTSNVGTITITLKNGKQIIKKNQITTQSLAGNGKTGSYEALITLTSAEANLLRQSEIASYDFFSLNKQEPEPQTAGVIKGAADCLIKN